MLGEPGSGAIRKRLTNVTAAVASPLLEAEALAVARRHGITGLASVLTEFEWVIPARVLSGELNRILDAGYLRGADAWHVATALYHFVDPTEAFFLTLDAAQRGVAEKLGFRTDWSQL